MWNFFAKLQRIIQGRTSGMTGAPLVVNPNDSEKIHLAISRLDAIRRYLEQTVDVSEAKLREFRTEARVHAAFLLHQGRIDEQQHDQLLKRAGV